MRWGLGAHRPCPGPHPDRRACQARSRSTHTAGREASQPHHISPNSHVRPVVSWSPLKQGARQLRVRDCARHVEGHHVHTHTHPGAWHARPRRGSCRDAAALHLLYRGNVGCGGLQGPALQPVLGCEGGQLALAVFLVGGLAPVLCGGQGGQERFS